METANVSVSDASCPLTAPAGDEETKYRELLDATTDLIQSIAPDGRLLYANKAMLTALGYAREELDAISIFDLIAPESRAHCAEAMGRVMKEGESGLIDAVFLTKGGARVLVRGRATCHFEGGRPAYTRGVFATSPPSGAPSSAWPPNSRRRRHWPIRPTGGRPLSARCPG